MSHSHRVIRAFAVLGFTFAVYACDSGTDPVGTGHASVQGYVTTSAGAPVPAATIRIACPSFSAQVFTADSNGHYGATIIISEHAFLAHSGHVPCSFVEPASGLPQVQLDTLLGFATGTNPQALQFVDLKEN